MSNYVPSTMKLPWSSQDDDAQFKKILTVAFIVFLTISVPILLIKLPELTRKEKAVLPPQLARMILEKQALPPPKEIEPPKVEAPVEPKPLPKPVEQRPVVTKPVEVKPTPTKDTEKPIDHPKNPDAKSAAVAVAREKAQEQIATFKDDLMAMRESLQTDTVAQAETAGVSAGSGKATQVDRSMINSGATKGSGGINVGAYASHDTGGTALAGREKTKVKSGLADAAKTAAAQNGVSGGTGAAAGAARSEEEIRKVMGQHQSALFSMYNRALRENASLQGKVVIKMVIDPAGRIVDVTIVSSELKDPDLEAKILQRIKLITFSAANVERTTLNYTFDFLPQ